jgi:hypothetical protein
VTAPRARNAEEETEHLMVLYASDAPRILAVLQSQLTNLASRAQVLLQLAGLTITVTGFSGANIARSGRLAAILVVVGLVVVLASVSLSISILRLRWTTQLAPCPPREAVLAAIELRDEKTLVFSRSLRLLVVGLALYIGSVSMMLARNLPDP